MRDLSVRIVTVRSLKHLPPSALHSVERMLLGDGTCSLENMRRACFAAEGCNRGVTPRQMSAHGMFNQMRVVLVALNGNEVVGVASLLCMSEASRMLGIPGADPDDASCHMLCNLCVAADHRHGRGVGRALLQAARTHNARVSSRPMYVGVARALDTAPRDIHEFMSTRANNLETMYRHLHFDPSSERSTPQFTIMVDVAPRQLTE